MRTKIFVQRKGIKKLIDTKMDKAEKIEKTLRQIKAEKISPTVLLGAVYGLRKNRAIRIDGIAETKRLNHLDDMHENAIYKSLEE